MPQEERPDPFGERRHAMADYDPLFYGQPKFSAGGRALDGTPEMEIKCLGNACDSFLRKVIGGFHPLRFVTRTDDYPGAAQDRARPPTIRFGLNARCPPETWQRWTRQEAFREEPQYQIVHIHIPDRAGRSRAFVSAREARHTTALRYRARYRAVGPTNVGASLFLRTCPSRTTRTRRPMCRVWPPRKECYVRIGHRRDCHS